MIDFLRSFNDWHEQVKEQIDYVRNLLSESLSDEPEELIGDLEAIEAWNARIGFILAQANSYLDQGKKVLMPSREGRTDFDRKAQLDAALSSIRVVRDSVESLCDSIKQRLILGESILSYKKTYAEHKAKTTNSPW